MARGGGSGSAAASVGVAAVGLVAVAGFALGSYVVQRVSESRRSNSNDANQRTGTRSVGLQRSNLSIEACQQHRVRPRTARACTRLQDLPFEFLEQTVPLDGLKQLPSHVVIQIIQCIDYTSLSRLATVCHSWRRHISLLLKHKQYIKTCAWSGFDEKTRFHCWMRVLRNEQTVKANIQLYRQFVAMPDEVVPMVNAIRRDLHRTLPECAVLADAEGRQKLFRVLKAYAISDPEASYCQGMNFLAGFLLTLTTEELAFAMLEVLMNEFETRWLYMPGLPHLSLSLWQLDKCVSIFMPDLYAHFQHFKVQPQLYASEWFVGLFTYTLPLNEAARVWDLFFTQGWKAIHKIALAILHCSRVEVLKQGFENTVRYLKVVPRGGTLEFEEVIQVARKFKLTNSFLAELEDQYYAGVPPQ